MVVVSVVVENAVCDMCLWYMFLDDVDYLVEGIYTYSVKNNVKACSSICTTHNHHVY
jgi:hypothetical protein